MEVSLKVPPNAEAVCKKFNGSFKVVLHDS